MSVVANGCEHIAALVPFSPLHPYQRSQKLQLDHCAVTVAVVLRSLLPVRQSYKRHCGEILSNTCGFGRFIEIEDKLTSNLSDVPSR
jgi:hypothetical protein